LPTGGVVFQSETGEILGEAKKRLKNLKDYKKRTRSILRAEERETGAYLVSPENRKGWLGTFRVEGARSYKTAEPIIEAVGGSKSLAGGAVAVLQELQVLLQG